MTVNMNPNHVARMIQVATILQSPLVEPDNRWKTRLVPLDIPKAFNRVQHDLLSTLSSFRCNPAVTSWISCFFGKQIIFTWDFILAVHQECRCSIRLSFAHSLMTSWNQFSNQFIDLPTLSHTIALFLILLHIKLPSKTPITIVPFSINHWLSISD